MQYDAMQFVCNKKRDLVLCSNQAHMHHTMGCSATHRKTLKLVLCGLSLWVIFEHCFYYNATLQMLESLKCGDSVFGQTLVRKAWQA